MKKQELAKGILHYKFDPRPGSVPTIGTDTCTAVVLNGKKAVLIDTGYESQASELLKDLANSSIDIEAVIITHFHDDHMEGLKFLPGIPVYGSGRFQETLDKWTPKEQHQHLTPTVVVSEPTTITFGEHTLTLIPSPGHSSCGLFVNIDNKFLHIADELMFSAEGNPKIPELEYGNVEAHINSLEKIKDYGKLSMILSHGPVIDNERAAAEIENRLIYLKALLVSNRNISFEDATKDCTCAFVHDDSCHESNCWHDNKC